MSSKKVYWKSFAQVDESNEMVHKLENNEFIEKIPVDEFLGDEDSMNQSSTNRRDFLKYVGFSTAAATLAACEGPVIKSVPYVVQPEQIIPGLSNYYATAIADGFDFASILIKTREGRPIKVFNYGKMRLDFTYIYDIIESILRLIYKNAKPKQRAVKIFLLVYASS